MKQERVQSDLCTKNDKYSYILQIQNEITAFIYTQHAKVSSLTSALFWSSLSLSTEDYLVFQRCSSGGSGSKMTISHTPSRSYQLDLVCHDKLKVDPEAAPSENHCF